MNDTERSTLPSRMRRAILSIACVSFAAACNADNATSVTPDDAARAVDLFAHLADSVSRAGGDADVGGAYGSLANVVRQAGRIAPIVITVDGVPTTFLATAQQTEVALTCLPSQFCALIASVSTLRTLIAWQQDDPRRVVQLASAADSNPIRAYLFPTLVPFSTPSASLVYFDGKGGTYFGTSGSQKVAMTPSTTPCTSVGTMPPVIRSDVAQLRCTQADYSVTFGAKAEPSTFLSKNAATGSHTFSMPAQTVLGARLQLVGYGPPLPRSSCRQALHFPRYSPRRSTAL